MIPSGGQPTDLRLYRPRVSTWWWTRKRTYFVFVMRELSSIFVGWFVVYLMLFAYAVGQGEAAYERFLDWAASLWPTALTKSSRYTTNQAMKMLLSSRITNRK